MCDLQVKSDEYVLMISHDNYCENPRMDECNLTNIINVSRYQTGECQDQINKKLRNVAKKLRLSTYGKTNMEIIQALSKSNNKNIDKYILIKELYAYEHGGIIFSLNPFSCPWDGGQSGYIIAIADDFNSNGISFKEDNVYEIMNSEVNTYNHYMSNSVFSFSLLDKDNNLLDSCCGIYCSESDVVKVIAEEYLSEYPELIEKCKNLI